MSNCSRCRYAGSPNELGNVECHRYPPVGRVNIFPLMHHTDWCGEWVRSGSEPAVSPPVDAVEALAQAVCDAFDEMSLNETYASSDATAVLSRDLTALEKAIDAMGAALSSQGRSDD